MWLCVLYTHIRKKNLIGARRFLSRFHEQVQQLSMFARACFLLERTSETRYETYESESDNSGRGVVKVYRNLEASYIKCIAVQVSIKRQNAKSLIKAFTLYHFGNYVFLLNNIRAVLFSN